MLSRRDCSDTDHGAPWYTALVHTGIEISRRLWANKYTISSYERPSSTHTQCCASMCAERTPLTLESRSSRLGHLLMEFGTRLCVNWAIACLFKQSTHMHISSINPGNVLTLLDTIWYMLLASLALANVLTTISSIKIHHMIYNVSNSKSTSSVSSRTIESALFGFKPNLAVQYRARGIQS